MQKRCILKAPAKINLHLEIGIRRQDGFHELKSLFIMTDLYDEICLSSLKTGNYCRITGDFNCVEEDNLIYKAWLEFCRETGNKFPADFTVEKKIPSFAGLGGGSSDAAAAIRAMDMLYDTNLGTERMLSIAEKIGSDVPFFISAPAAVIEGRGEKITPLNKYKELNLVVVQPDVKISTGEAYGWIDLLNRKQISFLENEKITDLYLGDLSGYSGFRNDFETVLFKRFDVFERIIGSLREAGAARGGVTGSGSAVYGVFESPEMAENARKSLVNEHKFVQKIKSLDRIPYAILE